MFYLSFETLYLTGNYTNQNWAYFVCCLKFIQTALKSDESILQQIVWETQK